MRVIDNILKCSDTSHTFFDGKFLGMKISRKKPFVRIFGTFNKKVTSCMCISKYQLLKHSDIQLFSLTFELKLNSSLTCRSQTCS